MLGGLPSDRPLGVSLHRELRQAHACPCCAIPRNGALYARRISPLNCHPAPARQIRSRLARRQCVGTSAFPERELFPAFLNVASRKKANTRATIDYQNINTRSHRRAASEGSHSYSNCSLRSLTIRSLTTVPKARPFCATAAHNGETRRAARDPFVTDDRTWRQNLTPTAVDASAMFTTRSARRAKPNSRERGFCRQKCVSRQNSIRDRTPRRDVRLTPSSPPPAAHRSLPPG
jgi:hypothetical protein